MLRNKPSLCILFILCLGFLVEASAQNRLYPTGRDNSKNKITELYKQTDSLLLDNRDFDTFAFTIRPAFGEREGCYYDYDRQELILKTGSWSVLESGNAKIKEFRCKISGKAANCIEELFYAAIYSSSYLAQSYVLDGVIYEIIHRAATAEFNPTKEGTNCYRLGEVIKELSTATKKNDKEAVENLIPEMTELAEEFKKLFPSDVNGFRPH